MATIIRQERRGFLTHPLLEIGMRLEFSHVPVLGWTVGLVMLAFAARFTWPPFTQTPPAPVRPE
jgi:hypothetical protein